MSNPGDGPQEGAPRVQSRVDPETLAALTDGRLTGASREQAIRQLTSSAEDRDMLADVLSVLGEMDEASEEPSGMMGPTRWRAVRLLLPLAAAAGVATLVLLRSSDVGPALPVVDVASFYEGGNLPDAWDDVGWTQLRGDASLPADSRALFRVGGRLVDLELASAASDSVAYARIAAELAALLGSIEATGALSERFAAPAGDVARLPADRRLPRGAASDVRAVLAEAVRNLGEHVEALRLSLALGRFEAARVALDRMMSDRMLDALPAEVADRVVTALSPHAGAPLTSDRIARIRASVEALSRELGG